MIREECSLWKLQVREAKTAHWIKLCLISMANKSAWIYLLSTSTSYPSPFENQRFVFVWKEQQWSFLLIPYFLTIHICTGSHCPAVAAVAVEGGESGVTVSIIQGKQPVECTHFSMGTFGKPFGLRSRLLLQPFLCRKLPPHLSYLKNLCQLAISMLSKAIKLLSKIIDMKI